MRRIFTILFIVTLLLGFTFVTLNVSASNSFGENTPLNEQSDKTADARMRTTKAISIPYGFNAPLPLSNGGQSVQVSGHGGCTENEQVTVAVTVTQSINGAVATAEFQQTCTGELQQWRVMATTDTITPFVADMAEGCGFATTRFEGEVTDTFDWCVDLALNWQNYIPLVLSE